MTNWPVKTLGDVCDFVRGVTFNKADSRSEMKTGFIPLLRATNITEKGLLREDFVFVPKNGVRADQKLMSGDALITIASGSASVVGRSVLVEDPGEMTFGAFCGVLRPSPEILPRYLSHFMSSRSVRTAWSEAAQGTNINNLKRDDILQTECLVPPLEEQKRIVALLDAATARVTELAACYERARTHANNLFTSAVRDALESNPDWPIKTLGEVAVVNPSEPALSEDAPFVPMDAVTSGKRDIQYTQPRGQRSGARARAGDILFARITPCLQNGKVALVQDELARCGGSTEFIVVRAGPDVLNGYLYQWITSDHVRDEVTALMKGATGRQRLNAEDLALAELPVPPLEEQKRIVALLDAVTARVTELAACYEQARTHANNLFTSAVRDALERNPDWTVKTLGDVYRVCSSKRVLKSEWKESGVPFYRGREVSALSRDGKVDNELFISEAHFEDLVLNYGVPKCDDIMITAIGTIGNSYIVRKSDRFYFKDASVLWLDKKSDIESGYVQYWFTSPSFREQLNSGNGATVDTLTIFGLSKMEIPVPPLEEQKRIVARLDSMKAKTSEMVAAYDAKLIAAKNLRQSILEAAFKGDL